MNVYRRFHSRTSFNNYNIVTYLTQFGFNAIFEPYYLNRNLKNAAFEEKNSCASFHHYLNVFLGVDRKQTVRSDRHIKGCSTQNKHLIKLSRPNTNTNTNTNKFPTGKQIQISDHVMWQIQSFFLVILFVSYLSTFDNNPKISCRKTKWIHPFLSEEIDDWVVHPKVAHSWKDQIKKQSSHNLFLCRPKKLFCAMFVPFQNKSMMIK